MCHFDLKKVYIHWIKRDSFHLYLVFHILIMRQILFSFKKNLTCQTFLSRCTKLCHFEVKEVYIPGIKRDSFYNYLVFRFLMTCQIVFRFKKHLTCFTFQPKITNLQWVPAVDVNDIGGPRGEGLFGGEANNVNVCLSACLSVCLSVCLIVFL